MDAPPWLDDLDLRADGPPWLAMGLRRVDEAGWLSVDGHRDEEVAERARLLDERWDEVVHLGPDTEAAGREVLDLVRAGLTRAGVTIPADLGGEHPLVAAGRLVQEDLCLMVPRPDEDGIVRHHLDAAVLCFPSHWRLADKAGRPAATIHDPVPTYADELSDKVDRYLDRLRPGVIGLRRNWSVHETPELFAPDPPSSPDPDVAPSDLWLRSERQTLRRLASVDAVLFTIRVQQAPFALLRDRPDVARAFAARLAAQPPELTAMNGLAGREGEVLTWLRGVGDQP